MSKYYKASDYYPDDKDIYDFLDSQTRSVTPLLAFLKSRSIFSSKDSDKEDLQNYISLLYFDWDSANKLVNIIDLRETEQKLRHTKYNITAEPHLVKGMSDFIKNERHDTKRETYNIQSHGDEVDIHVTYLDVDTSKTRVLQKKEKELHITANRTDEGWAFRHTDNERAKEIVDHLVEKLGKTTNQETITEKSIDISHIVDNKLRVSFFKKAMSDIEGMRLIDVSNIKVDRLIPIHSDSAADDEENGDQEADEELEQKLKKVVMYGADLFTTHEFQELVSQGFHISGAKWKSEKKAGQGEQVEFSANFGSPTDGKDFAYKVLGVYRRDDSGELKQAKEKVYGSEKKEYLSALESSAYNALQSIDGGGDESE